MKYKYNRILMPFIIEKQSNGDYKLFKKVYVKKLFRSREGAIGFGKNAIRFRERKNSKVVGNKILPV